MPTCQRLHRPSCAGPGRGVKFVARLSSWNCRTMATRFPNRHFRIRKGRSHVLASACLNLFREGIFDDACRSASPPALPAHRAYHGRFVSTVCFAPAVPPTSSQASRSASLKRIRRNRKAPPRFCPSVIARRIHDPSSHRVNAELPPPGQLWPHRSRVDRPTRSLRQRRPSVGWRTGHQIVTGFGQHRAAGSDRCASCRGTEHAVRKSSQRSVRDQGRPIRTEREHHGRGHDDAGPRIRRPDVSR